MSIPKISNFDFEQLSYSPALKATRAGGKCAQVGYGEAKAQVKFQLGDSVHEALLCKWGADPCDRNNPDAGLQIKLELTDKSKAFLEKFEGATTAAAEANSMAWFKKKKPTAMLSSAIKPDKEESSSRHTNPNPAFAPPSKSPCGRMATTTPTVSTIEDITPNSMVLPIVRVQGGVLHGATMAPLSSPTRCSFSRMEVSHGITEFDLDDVEMVDPEKEENESEANHEEEDE